MSAAEKMKKLTKDNHSLNQAAWEKDCKALIPEIEKAALAGKSEYKTSFYWTHETAPGKLDYMQDWLVREGFDTELDGRRTATGHVLNGYYIIITW